MSASAQISYRFDTNKLKDKSGCTAKEPTTVNAPGPILSRTPNSTHTQRWRAYQGKMYSSDCILIKPTPHSLVASGRFRSTPKASAQIARPQLLTAQWGHVYKRSQHPANSATPGKQMVKRHHNIRQKFVNPGRRCRYVCCGP